MTTYGRPEPPRDDELPPYGGTTAGGEARDHDRSTHARARRLPGLVGRRLAWALLLVANAFHVYSVATFLERTSCYICAETRTIIPWFVWFTSWCLWLTTAFFVVSVCFAAHGRLRDILIRLALPWSITTTISYTYYLVINSGGSDLVDSDLCYTVSDSAIQRSTPPAAAIVYLALDRTFNFTAHYGCAAINLFLYLPNKDLGYACDRLSWLGAAVYLFLGILIALVHTYVDQVYCTENIWSAVGPSFGVFLVVHFTLVRFDCNCRGTGKSMPQTSGDTV